MGKLLNNNRFLALEKDCGSLVQNVNIFKPQLKISGQWTRLWWWMSFVISDVQLFLFKLRLIEKTDISLYVYKIVHHFKKNCRERRKSVHFPSAMQMFSHSIRVRASRAGISKHFQTQRNISIPHTSLCIYMQINQSN